MYDLILFCHGLYGLKNKEEIIKHTIEMLSEDPLDGMVIILHRAGFLILDNLVSHRSLSFPDRAVAIKDDDEVIDSFTRFINRQALYNSPAAIVRPLDISQVQSCVRWALANKTSLAILGGGHSDHCLWPSVVSVDMSAFDKVHVVNPPQDVDTECWIVAEAGLPLGSRSSVGAGLWLQGGIGHLARHCGLAYDAIVSAVMVDVISGQVLCIGYVPEQHRSPNAVRHERDEELLWALKGAGTNFGIVISVTFKSYTSQKFPGVSHDVSTGLPPKTVDAIELFDKEMYVSKMHAGHGGGKTSAFKRCVFLKDTARPGTMKVLMSAARDGPTPYYHSNLVHDGKAVRDIAPEDTVFGCRDWDFACVVTGVWLREYDGKRIADAVIRWVYRVVNELLPTSKGVYSADLGPDPRVRILATKAFGPNRRRLVKLKKAFNPKNILARTCPLTLSGLSQKLVILVTGAHGYSNRVVSISEVTRRKYAAATGADPDRLINDQHYKEQHRKSLNDFFKKKLKADPSAGDNHFLEVLEKDASDVLFITGMTEMAPGATLSHLVHDARLIDVRVQASEATRNLRRWGDENKFKATYCEEYMGTDGIYLRNFTFDNEANGDEAVMSFAHWSLVPFMRQELQNLAGMVSTVPNFSREDIDFRYVLNIAQHKGGLALCTSLLNRHFSGDWDKVDAIITSEASGYVLASPLPMKLGVPLVLIARSNKFPRPTVSVQRRSSHISSHILGATDKARFMMDANAVRKGNKEVVVDDVLVTKTLMAVLELLVKVGLRPEDSSVMVVAEFPFHRGRQRLWASAFGRVAVQSLLVFDGQ
ncbi:adenine phosphoribosyltransferase [Fusarium acutatum]|uniref:Adenine phosphoribosyltransferase n=1 Tax=Fusarium acutatum TaxID=78861 RepID=A0A8H4NKS4_9HYPO|nr:adenine phosphoribosyltransferase [Fusarium acutatum]